MQLRKIRLSGPDVPKAEIEFNAGANVLAGQSDTGKSYLLHCLDYILGADELRKRIPEAELYSQLHVEFQEPLGDYLTLERNLSGGELAVHRCRMDDIIDDGERVIRSRSGSSQTKDLTSVLLPFAEMAGEAKLRKNDRGETQRLTVRTLLPIFLVNEIAMIDEKSPVVGDGTFDATARKRMFAYLLSGKDDTGIIAAERRDIIRARDQAKLGLIADLLEPLQRKVKSFSDDPNDTIEKVNNAIGSITAELNATTETRTAVLRNLKTEIAELQRAETQIIAINEVLDRYKLLSARYKSDLGRLDFIAEGAHYFDGLQEVHCPLCDQPMSRDHSHVAQKRSADVYAGARAEAAKIKALNTDLSQAITTLEERLADWREGEATSQKNIKDFREHLDRQLAPALSDLNSQLEKLIRRRVELEGARNDKDQLENLQLMKAEIERTSTGKTGTSKWEPLPSVALRNLCKSIETVLIEWQWSAEPRVEFDQADFDIVVDGQSRQSHGKGVRSILHSAFVIGPLRYSSQYEKPHPGFVVLDSPLTSYRKSPSVNNGDGPIPPRIEVGFWKALADVSSMVQVIVIENKEPPKEVADAISYIWFAGDDAKPGERKAFIPS